MRSDKIRLDNIKSGSSVSDSHHLTSFFPTDFSKAFQDAKEHIKLLKKAKRSALSRDAKVGSEPLILPPPPLCCLN